MLLIRIAISVTRMKAMKRFYNQVFNANLQAMETAAGTFYHGDFCGFALTLVPNSIAQIEASHNRQQFTILVDDIEELLAKAEAAGGQRHGEVMAGPEGKQAGILDPDGNTIEIMERTEKSAA